MNKWIGKGRTTSNIELKQTQNKKSYVKFTLACDGFKDKDGNKKADFIPCVAWNQTAETIANHVLKGQEILVEGVMRSGKYQDKTNPEKTNYTLECYVDRFEFCGKKSDNANTTEEANSPTDFEEIIMNDDEIPL